MGNLREILSGAAARIEGAEGIMLVGLDGIIIEKCDLPKDLRAEQTAAELASLVKDAMHSAEALGAGELRGLTVSTDSGRFLLQLVAAEYFLVLKLSANGNYGRARFELKKAHAALMSELAF